MFARDPRLPLSQLFIPKIRYLGNDQSIIKLEFLIKAFYLAAHNMQIARAKLNPEGPPNITTINPGDMVLLKDHTRGPLELQYTGEYRVITTKGNKVQIQEKEGGTPRWAHISHIKPVHPADALISHLPHKNSFGRMAMMTFHPDKTPNLKWEASNDINTTFATNTIAIMKIIVSPTFIDP